MKHRIIALIEQGEVANAAKVTATQAEVQKSSVKRDVPKFEIGDTVDIHHWIELGEKGRTQVFSGTVISLRGTGLNEMVTVRRIVQGEGVERIFPVHSPKIARIEVKRSGKVRRSKLYYLRDRVGKATKLKERKPKAAAAPSTNGAAAAGAPKATAAKKK
jgi:large subunit ribosomal protein L19